MGKKLFTTVSYWSIHHLLILRYYPPSQLFGEQSDDEGELDKAAAAGENG